LHKQKIGNKKQQSAMCVFIAGAVFLLISKYILAGENKYYGYLAKRRRDAWHG